MTGKPSASPTVNPAPHPSSSRRRRSGKAPRLGLWVGIPVFAVVLGVAAVAAYRVPVRGSTGTPAQILEERIRKGPDSYFHHIFDPDGLLGQLGSLDLDLDNFETETSHGVLVAALPHLPPEAPDLAMHAAEIWRPGVAGADNGVVVFIFPGDRRVQVLVGYGLEPALPDAEVHRVVNATFVPAARAGDLAAGVEALVPALLDKIRAVPRATPKHGSDRFSDVVVAAQEVPRRIQFVRGVWLANPSEVRLILSAIASFGVALFAAFLAHIGRAVVLFVRLIRAHARGSRLVGAGAEVLTSLLRPLQIGAILFVMAVGTSFFFPGTGSFGGAGVDFLW